MRLPQKEYQRRWNEKNPDRVRAAGRRKEARRRAAGKVPPRSTYPDRKSSRRALLLELKNRPCMDCGGTFDPVCMDFDHREGVEKLATVSALVGYSDVKLLAEIAKCDVVCSNCHRVRTKKRRQNIAIARDVVQLDMWRSKS